MRISVLKLFYLAVAVLPRALKSIATRPKRLNLKTGILANGNAGFAAFVPFRFPEKSPKVSF